MSFSNINQQRDRLSTQTHKYNQCVLLFSTYYQLQNHKRGYENNLTSANIISQYIAEDVEMQNDIRNNIIDNNELVSSSDYAVNTMEIDEAIFYKCSCSFKDSESEAHIYNSSRIGSNTFTKAKLMKPGAKISNGKTVDALLKSKSSVKGHEYDVCPNGCRLYGINDDQESCVDCGKLQYKTDTEQSQISAASMKLMSVSDMFSQMLADPATRELLYYRANRESVAGQLTNIFDGENYKQLVQQGLFSNPDDIVIGYTNKYLLQLAILPGPKKSTHLNSFLIPIISEIKDLEVYDLVIKSNGVEVCHAKIHLLLASADIPAVADMTHIGSHASLFGCQICKTKGKAPDNRWHGMYFEDSSAPLRPLEDFKTGNPRNWKAHLQLDHCVPYQGDKFFYTRPDDTLSTTECPFFIPRASLVTIGNCITSLRPYIPVSFQGSFDNVFSKIDGTHAVDWLDFLLYIVYTLVVPFLPNRAVKTAVLSLVKGCALALQWMLTLELLNKMDVHLKHWHYYLSQQVQNKTISHSVFRPVQHYLVHIPFIVKQLGSLRCYSTRSMERVIGVFSKLIKSKCKSSRNASFLVERFTLHNYINIAISIQNEIDLIQPKLYGRESYMNLSNDPSGAQLWEPFH
ncbi:hypothetical protein PHYBLDRAFT_167768 [Phycomyces blakesleeanus NRRL 1555(-)]|uniref:Uncharacterized protein n=1 Tax=Phycomyces blakesleeanus (strain ATCC 8743b / DSM 1359 / FGSC 10004 / NBRC 33097 / NRRL 1555) TaxID=763407 RepID=A0A167MX20_PHYB8|nr:hypothetical protein PHYBLDRAFT_167768 [Phycomyces blakesleeanus NRRL 1555(-)]OAD74354.1 hypothetical protein PHYBLDRAFT_167768 [Phycomyces blakesleeanus NRRL 1555(-)]|eukprot:XP_018292394.1 hypothetical protein PHYBLDRAFT_167768 [Phycomyces blakesleeanus NRRL 1555(-)]